MSHHSAKFGVHKHCGSGDMMFVVVGGQDFTCPHYCLSLKHMACYAHAHEISGRRHNSLPVCPMKDSRPWSHICTRAADGTYLKNVCQSVQKHC